MAENVKLPVIEFINLRNLTADYWQCLQFVAQHAASLKGYFLFNVRATGAGTRLPNKQWKTKIKSDMANLGFPSCLGMIMIHHELHDPKADLSDDEDEVDEADEDEVLMQRAYPSMRSLIMCG